MSNTSEISWANSNLLEDTLKTYQDYRRIENNRQPILNFRKNFKQSIITKDIIQYPSIIPKFTVWSYENIPEFQKILKEDKKIRRYITNKDDVWLLNSFFDTNVNFEELDDEFIENLFLKADFQFYLNKDENYLFIYKSELLEYDFGKLKIISPLDALRKYGLRKLEQAKEKVYVKVK